MKKSDELFKNTIIIALGTFTTKIISFLLVPLYTIWVSTSEYGDFDLLNTYISFIIPFITFQLDQAIFRFSLKNKKESKKAFINSFLVVIVNVIICNLIIFLLMHNQKYYLSFSLYFNFYAIYNCCSEYLRGINKIKKYSIFNCLVAILMLNFNILLVYFFKMSVNGMLMSYGLSYFIVSLIIIVSEKLFSPVLLKMVNLKYQLSLLKYSIPLVPNSIAWWITNVSDRTLINMYLNSHYNGLYAVSCKIPTLLSVFYGIFNLSWQQTAFTTINENDNKNFYNNLYDNLIKFLYSSAFIIISLTPFIFKYLISENFYDGIYQIPILLNAVIILSLSQFFSAIFLANMNSKDVGKSTSFAAIINLIINLILIKKIGLYAASLSTLVSYLFLFFYRLIKLKNIFSIKNIISKVIFYNIVFIMFIIASTFDIIYIQILVMLCAVVLFVLLNKTIIKVFYKKLFRR